MINEIRYYCYDCADNPEKVKADEHTFTYLSAAVVHIINNPTHFVELEVYESIEED